MGTHFIFALLDSSRAPWPREKGRRLPVDYSRSTLKTAAASVHGALQIRAGAIDLTVRTDGGGLCDGDDAYELELVGESGDLLLDEFTRSAASARRCAHDARQGRRLRQTRVHEAVVGAAPPTPPRRARHGARAATRSA